MKAISWLALSCVLAGQAGAQSIRGTAVDAAGRPVAGVVVLMLDDRSGVAARALTNEQGGFRVATTVPGTYRLRTLRIGFRPTTTQPIVLAQMQERVQQVVLSGVPISLDTIRVTGRNACRISLDSSAAVFALWEQARTALTATQLTSGISGVSATIVTYNRTLSTARDRVLRQTSNVVSGFTRGLWRSRSPELLRRMGYIVEEADGSTTYYAPDLTVLLSPAFLEDHCFRITSGSDATRVGMAFEPTRDRGGISGIRGTLWFDRKSAELRRLDFRYTNATAQQESGNAGGQVDFARAASGAWIVSAWHIRMPVLQQRQRRDAGYTTAEAFLREIRVEGGELSLLMRNQDTLWAHAPLVLAGQLVDSLSGSPLVGALIAVRGTQLEAAADSNGRFRVPGMLPGEYTLDIRPLSYLPMRATYSRTLIFTDGGATHDFRVPSAAQIAATSCPLGGNGVVGGIVRFPDGTPLRKALVSATWDDATPTGRRFGKVDAETDSSGAFRICRVPLDMPFVVQAVNDSVAAEARDVRITSRERFVTVELVLEPRRPQ
jgi:hypothetical protein